jgi:hypothetical protein
MTTWDDATEDVEYCQPGYMVGGYVKINYDISDGSGTTWSVATESSPAWTDQ